MTAAEAMAEMMEAHYIDLGFRDPDNTGHCICDEWVDGMGESWDEHLAEVLTAAGFGLVVDAKAEVLEEVADYIMGPSDYLADRATCHNIANDLRARAVDLRAANG